MTAPDLPHDLPDDLPDDPASGNLDESSNPAPHEAQRDTQSEAQPEPPPEEWPDSPLLNSGPIPATDMAAYSSTLHRVEQLTMASGLLCALAAVKPLGWPLAAGILAGTFLGWLNFRWLASSVSAIGERIANVHSTERGVAVVVRGVGRIFLIALAAYVIFTCSVSGLMGFLAGLAMPVLALMCEAVYEFVAINRRPS